MTSRKISNAVILGFSDGANIAKRFALKSPDAEKSAEMLGLMVNEPNIGRNKLSKITAPTLVICGRNDIIKESHTKEIAENIPNAKLSIMKGNHFIANKRYLTFNKEVESFLQNINFYNISTLHQIPQ